MKTSFPKDRVRIVLLENVHQTAIDTFQKYGYKNVGQFPGAWNEDELLGQIGDIHILGIRSKTQLTKRVLEKAEKLLAIGAFCIGTNQIDLGTATKNGMAVFNSPYSNTRSVAELVIAESIMLKRRVAERNEAAQEGRWLKDAKASYEVRGKTIGIVGYGHIGSQVSVLAENLGMNVIYHDIVPKLPLGNANAVPSLSALLEQSDIVTLHVPATAQTELMIGKKELMMMKRGAVLLNLSRGNVVDLEALRDSIKSGFIAGAGVDVFPKEPKSKAEKFVSPLQGLRNVILTPHIGGSTIEAQQNIGIDAASKLVQFLDNGSTVGSQSIPELNLPVQENAHRILHIHHNMPGILSHINKELSAKNINILGQYLKTNEEVGYVVLDIEKKASKSLLDKLKEIPHTIKVRVLY